MSVVGDGQEPSEGWHLYFESVGPFYDEAGAMRWLGGIDARGLARHRDEETILALRLGDGTWLYPAWQFDASGGVHAALRPVLVALRGFDRWAAAVWLTNAHPALDGASPRQALADGWDPRLIAVLADDDRSTLEL